MEEIWSQHQQLAEAAALHKKRRPNRFIDYPSLVRRVDAAATLIERLENAQSTIEGELAFDFKHSGSGVNFAALTTCTRAG